MHSIKEGKYHTLKKLKKEKSTGTNLLHTTCKALGEEPGTQPE